MLPALHCIGACLTNCHSYSDSSQKEGTEKSGLGHGDDQGPNILQKQNLCFIRSIKTEASKSMKLSYLKLSKRLLVTFAEVHMSE